MAETIYMGRNYHYTRGIRLYDEGLYTEAISELEQVEGNTPEGRLAAFFLGEAYVNLGLAHLRMKMYRRAEEELQYAVDAHPDYPDLRLSLALAFYGEGRYDESEAEFAAALTINQNYAKARIYLGLIHLRKKKAHGLAEIAHAVALQPIYDGEAYAKALALWRKGRKSDAIAVFEAVAAIDTDQVNRLVEKALLKIKQRHFLEAIALLTDAKEVCPHYADVRHYLGIAHMRDDNPVAAKAEFRSAIKINPRFMSARISLADAYATSGNAQAARRELEKVLEINPKSAKARRRLALLDAATPE
ncbi:MAG: tetratricopeptide repeat protein [Armatimonadota bacterium]